VQLDASTVYINLSLTRCKKIAVWCVGGRVDHAEELTRQFAMRVWTRMLRDNPQMAACFGRREVFVAMLLLRAR
jgi:hypothetical protein